MTYKLENSDLLSPEPIYIQGLGNVQSPTLRKIAKLTFAEYNLYINMLSLNKDKLINLMNMQEDYDKTPEDIKSQITLYDIMISKQEIINIYVKVFSFFIIDNVQYSEKDKAFLIFSTDESLIGFIDKDNYVDVFNIILKINYFSSNSSETKKYKSKKAKELALQIEKAKAEISKNNKENNNMDMANVISKLSVQHNSLNILNIWDITIYQLYDQFISQNYKNQNDIQSMNYTIWGGTYNPQDWYKPLTFL